MIGAPPGYVGYEEGGQLLKAVRRRPYSVVLFRRDRESASGCIQRAAADSRRWPSDGLEGRTVDFKNTVLIMTSNLGSREIQIRERRRKTGARSSHTGFAGSTSNRNSLTASTIL
jgi:ATP-dependent Clp protease ATP-binding subunit ClpA